MAQRLVSICIAVLLVATGCAPSSSDEPTVLRAAVTSSTSSLLDDLLKAYDSVAPNVLFEIEYGSAETVQHALRDGTSDWGLVAHLHADSDLWSVPIGTDALAIVVSAQNATPRLTSGQLRSIYQGRMTNWQQLGGPDMPIAVISREQGSGARALFDELVMSGVPTVPGARLATGDTIMIELVTQDPGAIGYISLATVRLPLRALPINSVAPSQEAARDGRYPLTSVLRFVAIDEPEGPARDFLSWLLNDEGQAIIAQQYAPLAR